MSVEIKSEALAIGGKEALLVTIHNGEAAIGTCDAGYTGLGGVAAKTRVFYIGNVPIVNIICPNHGDENSDKMISFCPGYSSYDHEIKKTIDACFGRLNKGEDTVSSIREILGLLEDGVYALYFSEYYPTDGAGSFFWGAYNIPHDIHGTAERSRMLKGNAYKPCFLVPSVPLDHFLPKIKANITDPVKSRPVQGIVYHLTGFHSVLLKGHHGTLACIDEEVPFKCLVIEKVWQPYTDPIELDFPVAAVEKVPVADGEDVSESADGDTAADAESEENPKPSAPSKKLIYPEGISGFRGASIKIPLEVFPKEMLKFLLTAKKEYKPRQFDIISAKLSSPSRKVVSNNALPYHILEKADKMPDCEMLESAYAISSLSDEQLNCLLAGDVECNGEVIVSANFYSSIIAASNYLLFTDTKRFVTFAIAIMDNPELIAAHDYISHRALTQGNNPKLEAFFQSVVDSGDAKYAKIMDAAETFLKRIMARR